MRELASTFRQSQGWTIRQIPAPGQELTRLPHPNTEHAASTATTISPCKIEYHVPAHVIVRKTCGMHPTVSWWDSSVDKWSTYGIIEVAWEPDSRKVSFLSHRLAQFSITQERHLDLPYQWWSIRPVGHLVCELTVQAAHYEFHFTISESGLRLKGPELPELHGIMFADCAEITANGGAETDGRLGEPILGREPRIRSPATLLCELMGTPISSTDIPQSAQRRRFGCTAGNLSCGVEWATLRNHHQFCGVCFVKKWKANISSTTSLPALHKRTGDTGSVDSIFDWENIDVTLGQEKHPRRSCEM